MELYDQGFQRAIAAVQRMEARIASEQMEGIIYSNIDGTIEGTIDSESELSIVSSNRFSGLEED
jgi:hypothetical protein